MKDFDLQTPEIQDMVRLIEKDYDSDRAGTRKNLKKLMDIAVRNGNTLICGFCHAYYARLYYVKGDLKRFIYHARSGIRVLEANEDHSTASICYNLLGIDAMNRGEYPISLEYYEEALRSTDHDNSAFGAALANIGHIYYEIGDFKKALHYCRRGQKYLLQASNRFPLLIALAQEATFCIRSKQFSHARDAMARLTDLETSLRDAFPDEIYTDLSEVLIYYYDSTHQEKKRDMAFSAFADALSRFDGSYIDFCENVCWIADTLLNADRPDLVGTLLDISRQSIMSSGISFMQLQFLERDIRYHRQINDPAEIHRLESDYFEISCRRNRENIQIYRTNISIHNDMNRLRREKERMERQNQILMHEASIDPLTQLANRALLSQKAEYFLAKAQKNGASLGVEMLDIDFFKELNDTYGHQQGDHCLQLLAGILSSISGKHIFAARYGGDEFMVIYYGMSDQEILEKAAHIRDSILQMKIRNEHSKGSDYLSVSQGIMNSVPTPGNRIWDFTYGADYALYQMKQTGKGEIRLLHSVPCNAPVNEIQKGK